MSRKLKPRVDAVLIEVKVDEKEAVSEGGIIMPGTVVERSGLIEGVVIALGDSVENYELGDEVLVEDGVGLGLKIDGVETILVDAALILGTYEE